MTDSSSSAISFIASGRLRQGYGRPRDQRSRNAIAQNRGLADKSVVLVPRGGLDPELSKRSKFNDL